MAERNLARDVVRLTLAVAVTVASPGQAAYAAGEKVIASGVHGSQAGPVVTTANVRPGTAPGAGPVQGRIPALTSPIVTGETGAAVVQVGAEPVQGDQVQQSPASDTLRQRLARIPVLGGISESLIQAGLLPGSPAKRAEAAKKIDFDHSGAAVKDPTVTVDEAGERVSQAAGALARAAAESEAPRTRPDVPGVRYYAYETERDYRITTAGKTAHYVNIFGKLGGKLYLMALFNKTVAFVYGTLFMLIVPKLMAVIRLFTALHLTVASPALYRHAPILADRREALAPHEELGQIPGVLKTIDVSERHDSAEGNWASSYFGSFLNRRVEKHNTLVMADRSLPAEIRAQDGALLGRLKELDGSDTLVFRARSRVGDFVATWTRTVHQLFAGDAVDAATAAEVRRGFDERYVRSAVKSLLILGAVATLIGLGVYLPLEHLHIAGAHTYGELLGVVYLIVYGVFKHTGGPRIFRKYFFRSETTPESWWSRVKRFSAEAWHESKEHHAHAVTVARQTAAGEEPLGDLARGGGAHSFAGNGLRRQLALNSPYLLGLMAASAVVLQVLHFTPLGAVLGPVLGAAAFLAAKYVVPRALSRTNSGLSIRKHDGDGRLTTLVAASLILGGLALVLALASQLWLAASAVGILAAFVWIFDPFTTKGAAAYDTRMRSSSIPWARGAVVMASMVSALVLLPASSAVVGALLAGGFAIALTSLFADMKHFFNPRIDDVKTPRSTPALAAKPASRGGAAGLIAQAVLGAGFFGLMLAWAVASQAWPIALVALVAVGLALWQVKPLLVRKSAAGPALALK